MRPERGAGEERGGEKLPRWARSDQAWAARVGTNNPEQSSRLQTFNVGASLTSSRQGRGLLLITGIMIVIAQQAKDRARSAPPQRTRELLPSTACLSGTSPNFHAARCKGRTLCSLETRGHYTLNHWAVLTRLAGALSADVDHQRYALVSRTWSSVSRGTRHHTMHNGHVVQAEHMASGQKPERLA